MSSRSFDDKERGRKWIERELFRLANKVEWVANHLVVLGVCLSRDEVEDVATENDLQGVVNEHERKNGLQEDPQ